ncbi:Uncharacterised protein [Vibrio cholerae]|nr:Uncharacterised protein [Vibrio cholerae]CSI88229.1 Uncharacterised protein [Vibrio cholerae]
MAANHAGRRARCIQQDAIKLFALPPLLRVTRIATNHLRSEL